MVCSSYSEYCIDPENIVSGQLIVRGQNCSEVFMTILILFRFLSSD